MARRARIKSDDGTVLWERDVDIELADEIERDPRRQAIALLSDPVPVDDTLIRNYLNGLFRRNVM